MERALGQGTLGWGRFGGGPYSISPVITITPLGTVSTGGPQVTINYGYSQDAGLSQVMVRVVVLRSDHKRTPIGQQAFYDSGWVNSAVTSGGEGAVTLDFVEAGIPVDTGSQSKDPTLHLVVRIYSSPTTNPDNSGWWGMAESPAFDIQWGVSTLTWQLQPASLVTTPEVSMSWTFTATRGLTQGSYDVLLTSTDGAIIFYDSTTETGATDTFTIPYKLQADTSYRITVSASNTEGVPAIPLTTIIVAGQRALEVTQVGGPLARFLAMLSFQLDTVRTYAEQLRNVNDPMTVPGDLLPLLAQELGVAYEADMGMAQTRKLLSTVVHEYKVKGTSVGIAGIATAVTGWGASVEVGPNLVLNNDVTAALTTTIANLSAASVTTNGSGNPVIPAAYTGGHFPAAFPEAIPSGTSPVAANAWFMAPTQTSSASMTWSTLIDTSPLHWGIPIPPGSATVSAGIWIYSGGLTVQPTMSFRLHFWNALGTSLGTLPSSPSTTTLSASAWTQFTQDAIAVPAGTVWASLELVGGTVAMTATGVLILAAPQLEIGSTLDTYSQPRELQIILDADRVNLVENPSFESASTAGWSVNANCTITAISGTAYQVPAVPTPGTHSCQVTSVGVGPMSVISSLMPIDSALLYTGIAHLRPQSVPQPTQLGLLIFDVDGNQLLFLDGTIELLGPINQEVEGIWVQDQVQVDPTLPLPDAAAQAQIVIHWLNTNGSGEVHLLDAIDFEEGWSIQPYFDAGLYNSDVPQAADYIWEDPGTPLGPSFYYRNFTNKITRLQAVLTGQPDQVLGQKSPLSITGFLPAGASFSLVTPQPV